MKCWYNYCMEPSPSEWLSGRGLVVYYYSSESRFHSSLARPQCSVLSASNSSPSTKAQLLSIMMWCRWPHNTDENADQIVRYLKCTRWWYHLTVYPPIEWSWPIQVRSVFKSHRLVSNWYSFIVTKCWFHSTHGSGRSRMRRVLI